MANQVGDYESYNYTVSALINDDSEEVNAMVQDAASGQNHDVMAQWLGVPAELFAGIAHSGTIGDSGKRSYVLSFENGGFRGLSAKDTCIRIFLTLKFNRILSHVAPELMYSEGNDKPQQTVKGDADGDGVVTIADAASVLTTYAKMSANITCMDSELKSGDINGDGKVDLIDVQEILTIYAKSIVGIASINK